MNTRAVFGLLGSVKARMVPTLLFLAVSAQMGGVGEAAGGRKAIPDYPVKVEFRDALTDNILSVGGSTYTNGETAKSGQVTAMVASSTGWITLSTRNCTMQKGKMVCSSVGRYNFFDFSESVNPKFLLPTSNGWSEDGKITTSAAFDIWPLDSDGVTKLANGFRDVTRFAGETRLGGMKANFRDASGSPAPTSTFTLRFTPSFYPESSYVLITYLGGSLVCSSADPSQCASWTVEALAGSFTPQPSDCCALDTLDDVAGLPNEDNSIDYGTFRMPFKILVTVLPKN